MDRAEVDGTGGQDSHAVGQGRGGAGESVSMETNILEDLKVNSARLVDVVIAFEDEFDIEIADEDVDSVNTVGDAVTLISGEARSESDQLSRTRGRQGSGMRARAARAPEAGSEASDPSTRSRPIRHGAPARASSVRWAAGRADLGAARRASCASGSGIGSPTSARAAPPIGGSVPSRRSPLLICANHLTMVDSFLIAWALGSPSWLLRDRLRLAALEHPGAEELRRRPLPAPCLIFLAKCIPITRGGAREDVGDVLERVTLPARPGRDGLHLSRGRPQSHGSRRGDYGRLGRRADRRCGAGLSRALRLQRGRRQDDLGRLAGAGRHAGRLARVHRAEERRPGRAALAGSRAADRRQLIRMEEEFRSPRDAATPDFDARK